MTSVLVGIAIIVVAMLVVAIRRGLQMRRLVDRGVVATATIEKIWSHTGAVKTRRYRMRYTFRAVDGREYSRSIMISPGERGELRERDNVAVTYLPENPRVSALADSVEQARAALKR